MHHDSDVISLADRAWQKGEGEGEREVELVLAARLRPEPVRPRAP
jgi:hypothetical protein